MRMSKRSANCFTLIELVTVISYRHPCRSGDASIHRATAGRAHSKLHAARSAVIAAMALIHSAILTRNGTADVAACATGGTADNLPGTPNALGSVCSEYGLIATVYGYPASTVVATPAPLNPDIVAATGLSTIFNPTLANLQSEGYNVAVAGGTTTHI